MIPNHLPNRDRNENDRRQFTLDQVFFNSSVFGDTSFVENTLRGHAVFYSRIWNEKGEAVKYETIKQLSKNRQRNYHLQKSASAGE